MSIRLPEVADVRSAPASFCTGFATGPNSLTSRGLALPSGAGRPTDQISTAEMPPRAVPAGVTVG
jgi:hypothetical protein